MTLNARAKVLADQSTSRRSERRLAPPWARQAVVVFLALALLAAFLNAGCVTGTETTTTAAVQSTTTTPPPGTSAPAPVELVLASTAMTRDTGLLDVLVPAFSEAYPQYAVKLMIFDSSAEALNPGEVDAADVLLVHSPATEEVFMANGLGVERRPVMYTEFMIVGPRNDPAGIWSRIPIEPADAFAAIARAGAPFFGSDEPHAYDLELALWEAANVSPAGAWYRRTNQGMAETAVLASQAGGYTLVDRSTYNSTGRKIKLRIMVQHKQALVNPYHVIALGDAKNMQGAVDFVGWITSDEVQQELIATFRFQKFGLRDSAWQLFVPTAREAE